MVRKWLGAVVLTCGIGLATLIGVTATARPAEAATYTQVSYGWRVYDGYAYYADAVRAADRLNDLGFDTDIEFYADYFWVLYR